MGKECKNLQMMMNTGGSISRASLMGKATIIGPMESPIKGNLLQAAGRAKEHGLATIVINMWVISLPIAKMALGSTTGRMGIFTKGLSVRT